MKITNLRVQKNRYFARAIAHLVWENCDLPPQEIYFEVPSQYADLIDSNPDAFFVAGCLPAMYYGESRLYMEEAVCPELQLGMTTALAWIHHWFQVGNPDLQFDCPVRALANSPMNPQRTASFFTGGIDSWSNLLNNHQHYPQSHPGYLQDLFMVYGLQNIKRSSFERAVKQFQTAGSPLGINFIPVYTNIYAYLLELDGNAGFPFWQNAYNGAALAAIGHIFHQQYSAISIASGNDIPNLVPLGTHPNLDVNFSSYNLRITHDGLTLSRLAKTQLVVQSEFALANLRVCDMPDIPEDKQNCGVCEKCIRTALTLEALGCLQDTNVFPYQRVTPQIAENMYIKHTGVEGIYQDLIPLLEARGRSDLVQVVQSKIRRFHLERLDGRLCGGLIFSFAKRLKSLLVKEQSGCSDLEISLNLSPSFEENLS